MDFINSIVSQKDSRIIALLGADWSTRALTGVSDLHTPRLHPHHFCHHMGTISAPTWRELVSRNWVLSGPGEKAEHSLCPTVPVYWLHWRAVPWYFLSLGTDAPDLSWGIAHGLWDWLPWYGRVGVDGRRAPTIMVYFTRTGTTLLRDGTGTTAMGGTTPMQWRTRHGHATTCFSHGGAACGAHTPRMACALLFCCCCSRLFLRSPTLYGGMPAIFLTLLLVYAGCGWNGCDRIGRPNLSPKELRHPRPPRRDGR